MRLRMGRVKSITRYAYWSDRRVRSIAHENGIKTERRTRMTYKSPSVPLVPGVEINTERREFARGEIACRVETAIGDLSVENFSTPPPIKFAKGRGNLTLSRFVGGYSPGGGMVTYTNVRSSEGSSVDICLFGSLDNMAGFAGSSDKTPDGWVSSAAHAIEEFVRSSGTLNVSQWDDPESISVEAMKIARYQGITHESSDHDGRPWTRGFTLGHSDDAQWFAEIYSDVTLDKNRWSLDEDVDRILIGAPLWIRTTSQRLIRYRDIRAKS
jgi:hypothetical protein